MEIARTAEEIMDAAYKARDLAENTTIAKEEAELEAIERALRWVLNMDDSTDSLFIDYE